MELPEEKEEELINDLQELRDIVEQIDMAHIVVKYGGIEVLLQIVESKSLFSDELKGIAISSIATICQNHSVVQESMYEQNILDRLASYISTSAADDGYHFTGAIISKILYAISSMIRSHEPSEIKFLTIYADSLTRQVVRLYSANAVTMKRLLFLINALLSTHNDDATHNLFAEILIPTMFLYLLYEDVDIRELSMKLLMRFYQDSHRNDYTKQHQDELLQLLQQRLSMTLPFDISEEQDEHEKSSVRGLIRLINSS
jgi:hypothetical protein